MAKLKKDGVKSRFLLFVDDLKGLTWKKWLAVIFVLILLSVKLHKLITTGSL